MIAAHDVCNGIEQMRFSQAGLSIDKQRIVVFGRIVCDSGCRGVCKFVGRADDKLFKGVLVFRIVVVCDRRRCVSGCHDNVDVRGE